MTSSRQTAIGSKVETKTIVMSLDNIEAAVASFLYALGAIPESWDITSMDLDLPTNADGLVEFQIEIVRPFKRNLRLVNDNGAPQEPPPEPDDQPELPFSVFDVIHVKDP